MLGEGLSVREWRSYGVSTEHVCRRNTVVPSVTICHTAGFSPEHVCAPVIYPVIKLKPLPYDTNYHTAIWIHHVSRCQSAFLI